MPSQRRCGAARVARLWPAALAALAGFTALTGLSAVAGGATDATPATVGEAVLPGATLQLALAGLMSSARSAAYSFEISLSTGILLKFGSPS